MSFIPQISVHHSPNIKVLTYMHTYTSRALSFEMIYISIVRKDFSVDNGARAVTWRRSLPSRRERGKNA